MNALIGCQLVKEEDAIRLSKRFWFDAFRQSCQISTVEESLAIHEGPAVPLYADYNAGYLLIDKSCPGNSLAKHRLLLCGRSHHLVSGRLGLATIGSQNLEQGQQHLSGNV